LRAPKNLGHYELEEKLGSGGMGVVYKARDKHLDRWVAVKILRADKVIDQERKRRFIYEAKWASSLNHPNVITIHDIGEENETLYMVMELVGGKSLHELIPDEGLPVETAMKYASQIVDALAVAHGAGIVHRDLKPANIMVNERGLVKILDFGLAKLVEPETENEAETRTMGQPHTQDGMLMGSAPYMSPEQAEAQPVDARTDIFSIGVVLYEMLTGDRPFRAPSTVGLLAAIMREEPRPLHVVNRKVPDWVEGIVHRCLSKDRDSRYQNGGELKKALEEKILEPRRDGGVTPSVAVLPFVNLNQDEESDFFSDGVTEDVLIALSKVPGLRVPARSAVFRYKGNAPDAVRAGKELNVSAVVEGSVRRMGKRLRIVVELINADDGYQIWSERYDRTIEDIFDIQDEISRAIVDALKEKLFGATTQPMGDWRTSMRPARPANIDAHEAYLKGRYHWNRRTWESLHRAIEFFNEAIGHDPAYAPAYVGLADTWNLLGYYNERPPRDAYPKAKAAASKALNIDEASAEANASLGYATLFFDWNWSKAEGHFQRAIELNPKYASAHQWLAWLRFAQGRMDEALKSLEQAHMLDPLSLIINNHYAIGLMYAGRGAEAEFQIRQNIELDSGFALNYLVLGTLYQAEGQMEEALESFSRTVALTQGRIGLGRFGFTYAISGKENEARDVLRQLDKFAASRYVSPLEYAQVHAGLGEAEAALECLEDAVQERTSDLIRMKLYPWPDAMRSHERFDRLVRAIRLP
jgi:serine/threonine protein kinase/tetratricopeptide (TPR) repeat protein